MSEKEFQATILRTIQTIYNVLFEIKKELKKKNEIKELERRMNYLETKLAVLEATQNVTKTSILDTYKPPITYRQDEFDNPTPWLPKIFGGIQENISAMSKEIDSNMPGTFKVDENNNVKVPHIAKEFKKK